MNSSIVFANALPVENARFPALRATTARDHDAKCVIFTQPFEEWCSGVYNETIVAAWHSRLAVHTNVRAPLRNPTGLIISRCRSFPKWQTYSLRCPGR